MRAGGAAETNSEQEDRRDTEDGEEKPGAQSRVFKRVTWRLGHFQDEEAAVRDFNLSETFLFVLLCTFCFIDKLKTPPTTKSTQSR